MFLEAHADEYGVYFTTLTGCQATYSYSYRDESVVKT
jgi:hypothetical protein